MRISKYLLSTCKNVSFDNEIISYRLMLRAGLVRKLSSGLYIWLPTGLRVLKKIENIVRKQMNKTGAIEILMPIVQPADLWQKSGRWEKYGPELLKITDRHNRLCVLGPTHEEVITNLIRNELNSYKQLPINLYQIQTKFRDEIRSRFGVIRSREFIMKDAYSFHLTEESLKETYDIMYNAYCNIFNEIGLNFRVVQANTGSIGGNISHEFQVVADSGEDRMVFSTESNYAANIEFAESAISTDILSLPTQDLLQIDTPNVNSITSLVNNFHIPIEKTIKTLIVKGSKENRCNLVALLIRGDHELNAKKIEKLNIVNSPLTFADEKEIRLEIGAGPGSIGPIGLHIPIIIDRTVSTMSDFTAGANIDGKHYTGINWGRDLPITNIADIRNVVEGDFSPDGKGLLKIKNCIEVGHIFQLGTRYSNKMKAFIQTRNNNKTILMGCYGIGITRIIAAVIEQNYDKHGIIWPIALSPFEVAIIPINMYGSCLVRKTAEDIYNQLILEQVDVILDDRKEHPGIMLTDIELIGIPYIIIIGDNNLRNNIIECKIRLTGEIKRIKKNKIIDFILKKIK
ncbi:proline--tRNA ligase [Candidatus Pantoea edessiphila]|uniref:Proline--tRNA ligase n=1 Tax=Candidatus Pantoea edessiphila TaxID=2044610 RepID=A0A2P5T0A4_9GAMM|nr:proline--tRNA ligase [Candidatus Pantoea edessiphila]PPI88011.1 proline--tRNA ligase [Candidatus Pantoea edessiphila]